MLTFEQIKELIELVATHRMSGIELERSGFRLQVDGYQAAPVVQSAAVPSQPAAPAQPAAAPLAAPAPATSAPAAEEASTADDLPADAHIITSPIVGTFYRAPNPEAPSFAEEGSKIKKGQVLCIVEAMKLMNEIESDVAGEVLKVYPENGQPVEFGQNLFAVRISG